MVRGFEKEFETVRPGECREEAIYLSLLLTAEHLKNNAAELFRTRDLTHAQYNVLRILRGAGNEGLSCREIGDRMISRDSDVTRMLDRLEKQGLIRRERQLDDRRVVLTYISEKGRELLAELDAPIKETHREALSGLSAGELDSLGRLLKKIRKSAD